MKAAIFFAFLGIASANILRSEVESEVEDRRLNIIPIYGFGETFEGRDGKEAVSSPFYGRENVLRPFFYFNFPTFSDVFKGFPFYPFVRQPEETSFYSAYVQPFTGGYYYQYPLGYRYVGTSKTPLFNTPLF